MKSVAIVGSGISGMSVAYLLSPFYHVTLYEKNSTLGGHTRTKMVPYQDKFIPVDTGFIVFNPVNYPQLTSMFRHLDVEVQKSAMSFGFSMDKGALEWGAGSLNALFGQRANLFDPKFYAMLLEMLRFFRLANKSKRNLANMSLGEFLASLNLSHDFKSKFILPMGAAIWSASAKQMLEFPANTFIQFFKNHGLLSVKGQHQWYTVTGGSHNYISKLMQSFESTVRLSTEVTNVVSKKEGGVELQTRHHETVSYDHVILATEANEALKILASPSEEEKAILGAFKYQPNHAFLHQDENAMPKQKRCWSSWNYLIDTNQSQEKLSVTYWMNSLQNIDKSFPLFVTLNPLMPPKEHTIFDEHVFMHPLFNNKTRSAQEKIPSIQGKRAIWFCGAYQRYGFHEDGLLSAMSVAQSLGATVPWH